MVPKSEDKAMSRTRVQQTQISGSLSSDILDNLAAGSELAAQSTLVGDLNAMRSQLNKIIGVGNWYDELAGTQDLADIQGAMQVTGADAAFQGDVSAAGELSALSGNFVVETGEAGYAEDGYGAYYPATVGGLPLTEFHLDEGYGDKTAVFVPGASIFAWRPSSRAMLYLTVSSSTFNVATGRTEVTLTTSAGISIGWSVGIVGNASPDGADHTISAGPTADTMTMTGEIKISGDVAQRLYIVGANGEISDEAGLNYDGSELTISGNLSALDATLTGNLSAISGSFSGDVSIAGDIKIADDAMNSGRLYMVGPNGEIASESKLAFLGQMTGWELNVDGSIVSNGQITAASGSFSGNLDAVDGTFSGNLAAVDATLSGDLSAVDGTFSGDLSAVSGSFSAVSISGDVAQRLYIVGADGSIKDESKLTFDGSELAVDGDLAASGDLSAAGGDFSVAAGLAGTPEGGYLGYAAYGESSAVTILGSNVTGLFPDGTPVAIYNSSDWTIPPHYTTVYWANGQPSGGSYNAGGAYTTMNLSAGMGALAYDAVVALVGNPAPAGAAVLINISSPAVLSMTGSIKISGDVSQRLYIVGADGEIKDESKLIFDGSELAIDGNLAAVDAVFSGNVQVDGDLRVKGSMTYIDTQNMRVQDAFIYLATGSAGTTDSGIVLARGAGADMDLVIGQDGGAGEVIFGKANRAPDGGGAGDVMEGISLVPAWMREIKLGGVEGSLSGSFSIEGNNMKLEAANDLSLAANGESVGLMSAADYTLFDSNFSATSIVGALNELYAAGAGGAAKGNLALSDVTVDVLDFSAVGTLSSADHKFIDVYLNGVLLAPGIDVTAVAVDNVTLAAGVVSELAVDDVFTVVLRGAAAS